MKIKSGLIVMVVVLLIGCLGVVTGNYNSSAIDMEQEYDIKSYITEEMKAEAYVSNAELCLLEEFTPEKIGNDADSIVLATVLTLDDADPDASMVGMTNGTMLINQVLTGNLSRGQVINYSKPGGVMKMSEWEECQPEAATQKRQYLREQNNVEMNLDETYINLKVSGDIEIEAGKSYLVYLKSNKSSYEIIGLGNGLRELDVTQQTSRTTVQDLNTSSLKIKNNQTGEFESLENYINTYISKGQEK